MPDLELEKLRIEKRALRPKARKRKRRMWIAATVLLAGALGALYRLGLLTPAVEVQAAVVQNVYPSQGLTLLNASGYVVADRKSAVASKVTGRLVFLGVEEGSRVKEGQVIARLESRDAAAARDRAAAECRRRALQPGTGPGRAGQRGLGLRTYKTDSWPIREPSRGPPSTRPKPATRPPRRPWRPCPPPAAPPRRRSRRRSVLLDYTNIRAPFDAVVLTKNADIGDIVTPARRPRPTPRPPWSRLPTWTRCRSRSMCRSRTSPRSGSGSPARSSWTPFRTLRFRGRVHMIVPTADRSKAIDAGEGRLSSNATRAILPEMSAKVAFLSRPVAAGEQAPRARRCTRDGASSSATVATVVLRRSRRRHGPARAAGARSGRTAGRRWWRCAAA
ncbi:MAG: efflux RND transporter periplasmic adaptor subunit [Comamonadaceae bacterium]|nr:efflux RND transporter periplasmic adaptor subunit [Comamonadaceae bacterium]